MTPQAAFVELALEAAVFLLEGRDGLVEGRHATSQLVDLFLEGVDLFLEGAVLPFVGLDHQVDLGLQFPNLAVEFLVLALKLQVVGLDQPVCLVKLCPVFLASGLLFLPLQFADGRLQFLDDRAGFVLLQFLHLPLKVADSLLFLAEGCLQLGVHILRRRRVESDLQL